jgi:hypothetical protein
MSHDIQKLTDMTDKVEQTVWIHNKKNKNRQETNWKSNKSIS